MLFEQNGRCGVCGNFFIETPKIDHNHKTGEVRGLLCHRCNVGLPYVEDLEYSEKAKKYLISDRLAAVACA